MMTVWATVLLYRLNLVPRSNHVFEQNHVARGKVVPLSRVEHNLDGLQGHDEDWVHLTAGR
jgi:hypothetical protein